MRWTEYREKYRCLNTLKQSVACYTNELNNQLQGMHIGGKVFVVLLSELLDFPHSKDTE